jgi:pimeloyl-ACP methyl ester carboxylesterase
VSGVEVIDFGAGLTARIRPGPHDRILWIHGYTLDSSSWAEIWGLLPGWYHIGIDLPGHGGSRPLTERDDLRSLGRAIGRHALDHGARHIVALSFGTIIATQVAITFPAELRTLILGATSLSGGPQDSEVERLYDALIRLYHERGPGPHLRELWMTSPPPLFQGAENRPELWRELWQLVGEHRWLELDRGAMRQLTSHPQRESDLRRIQAATLILLGDNEMAAFRRCGEIIHRAIPDATRHYLPNVGHLCMLEVPGEASALIEAHLRAHAAAAP